MAEQYRCPEPAWVHYWVIDSVDGTELGEFGTLTEAECRAVAYNRDENTTRRYQVHRIRIDANGRLTERTWIPQCDDDASQ